MAALTLYADVETCVFLDSSQVEVVLMVPHLELPRPAGWFESYTWWVELEPNPEMSEDFWLPCPPCDSRLAAYL
jgi:hypothetical protein